MELFILMTKKTKYFFPVVSSCLVCMSVCAFTSTFSLCTLCTLSSLAGDLPVQHNALWDPAA